MNDNLFLPQENKSLFIPLLAATVAISCFVFLWFFLQGKPVGEQVQNLQSYLSINVEEKDIDICKEDSDCTIVKYDHCCGLTKRAINKKYQAAYLAHPEWQKMNDPKICGALGICSPDNYVTEAKCTRLSSAYSRCQLKY